MTEPIHVRARKFLQEFFNDEELTTLCFDYFPQVYNDFTIGMTKSQKVVMLVSYSQRRGRLEELLAALERERTRAYQDRFSEKPRLIPPEPQLPKASSRNPNQIFISHAHQDAEFARRLATDLQENGWETWMAPDDIRPGEKWVEAINRGLSECGLFLLVLTPEAVNSRWVQSEMNAAIGMEHRGQLRVLPLSLKSTSVPILWESYQWIPLDRGYEDGLTALLSALKPTETNQVSSARTPNVKIDQETPQEPVADAPKRRSLFAHPKKSDLLVRIGKSISRLPNQLLYGVGSMAALVILVLTFWPDPSGNPISEPTEVAEAAIATGEVTNIVDTPQVSGNTTPTPESATPTMTHTASPTTMNTVTVTPMLTPSATPTIDPNSVPPSTAFVGSRWVRTIDDMEMVFVPGGTFLMGSDPNNDSLANEDEIPQHDVELDSFWIDRTEVTNDQFGLFIEEMGYLTSAEAGGSGFNYIDGVWEQVEGAFWQKPQGNFRDLDQYGNHPVVQVSWQDARAYCSWAGGRLPTEAQWEYAARGDDGPLYPWGDVFDSTKANFCDENCDQGWADQSGDDGFAQTAPVGSYSPAGDSWVFAADMAGNVKEWVWDWYDANYYENAPASNPRGASDGTFRVFRGGGWFDDLGALRSTDRATGFTPENSYDFVGFRCVVPQEN